MKIIKLLLVLLVPVAVFAVEVDLDAIKAGRVKAALTIKVVDDSGSVVTGSTVKIWFKRWNDEPDFSEGVTDSNGLFAAEGRSYWGDVVFHIEKDGFYKTSGKHQFANTQIQDDRFQPWNPVSTQLLRKIINPVPMYVKFVEAFIPEAAKPIGFDFKISDWMEPYGKGKEIDIIFESEKNVVDMRNYQSALIISFPNKSDGIIAVPPIENNGSELILNQEAPESGYLEDFKLIKYRIPSSSGKIKHTTLDEDDNYEGYIFRTQTVVDEKGNVIKALYGKIYSITYDPRDKLGGFLRFTYFLNPIINDRSLEYNGQNLFKDEKRKFGP